MNKGKQKSRVSHPHGGRGRHMRVLEAKSSMEEINLLRRNKHRETKMKLHLALPLDW